MADAQTPVLTDEQILALANTHTRDVTHPTRYVLAVLPFARAILAAQAPAHPTEAVGTLSIQRFRGHLENASFDYTGALPDGDYALYTHPAPSQPDRAVMQQALDALQTLLSMQAEWHAAFPEHVGDKEAPAMQAACSAIAALSATMEKP